MQNVSTRKVNRLEERDIRYLGGKATKTPEVSEEDRAAEETPLPLRL